MVFREKNPYDEERARQVSPAILNYSTFSTLPGRGIFGRYRAARRDVDETQKCLIYHVETCNAKIVARIRSGQTWRWAHASVRDHAEVIGLQRSLIVASRIIVVTLLQISVIERSVG